MLNCLQLKNCFYFSVLFILVITANLSAQTCTGSLGDPIVNITFGSGANFGPPLAAGTTSSLQYQADICPSDGNYAILNYTSGCWQSDVVWHAVRDHTGDANGYYMLINASYQPSNFYIQTINGLCAGTTYQFAAWLLNMCSVKGILPDITFTIEKTDGTILSTYNTGDIPITNPAAWKQYGLFFTTPSGVSTVVLRMRNNSAGGMGNDLALDDITFKPAGPNIVATSLGSASNQIITCANSKAVFTLAAVVENCYVNTAYQWQVSKDKGINWLNISGANNNVFIRNSTAAGNYLYRLLAAEASNIDMPSCRVSSNIISINVKDAPQITIATNGLSCSGDNIILTAAGGKSYLWTGPNGYTSIANPALINNAAIANAGNYTVTVSDSFGCNNNLSAKVDVYTKPMADFNFTGLLCEKNIIAFSDNSNAYEDSIKTWVWNFGDGTAASNNLPIHTYLNPATFSVSLSVINNKGCKSDLATKQLLINPLPQPDFILPAVCLADPFATFINSSFISDSSINKLTYLWNFGDKNATDLNPNSATQQSPKHTYTEVGNYPVMLSVTSKDGCVKEVLKTFTVNGAQPVSKFVMDSTVNFCSNQDIIFIDSSSVNFGNITKVEIYWDNEKEPSLKITDPSPQFLKKYSHRYNNLSRALSKIFVVRFVVYSGLTCINETIKSIQIYASPVVTFASLKSICEGAGSITLTQGSESTGVTGVALYSGDGVTPAGIFDPMIAKEGSHIIRYTFVASGNCIAYAEQPIVVLMQPQINAGPDRTILSGGSIVINAAATGANLQYDWEPNIGITNNKVLMPAVSPLQNTVYTINVISADGCKAMDNVKVTVYKDIYIPTAFSPNGDGVNDTWVIPFLDSYGGASVFVYNRYGQIVFASKGSSLGWDGKFNGIKLPSGTYVWVLKTGDNKNILHGTCCSCGKKYWPERSF